VRSADSPEDDYLAGRSREEIREERELAAALALARRWEVPASAYDPNSPEPEPRPEPCSHCRGTGIAHRLARIDEDDVCTWCFGSGEVED